MATPDFHGYHKEDEPLPYGSAVDYRYMLDVVTKRRDDERDRLDRIESKIAVVIAGAFAALGFSLEKAGSLFGTIAAGLYLIPIVFLLLALLPITYHDAPKPREFEEKFPWYPVTTVEMAVGGIVDSLELNHPKIEGKTRRLRIGIWGLVVVTCLVVAVKFFAALTGSEPSQHAEARPNSRSRLRQTRARSRSRPRHLHAKACFGKR